MMWNALISALLVRSSIVMLDGDPMWPDTGWQWRVAEETRPTFMGASPAFLMACRKAGLEPGRDYDLDSIRVFGTAGSPLPAEGYRYVYDQLGPDVLLINGSGGTDVCSGIVGGSPLLPVYEGEISGRLLGVAADAFDPQGEPLVGELGELVITQADAVDARRALGRHRRLPLPQLVLRACSRGSGARATGSGSRSAAAASSRAARMRRSTAAASASARASSTASSRSCRRSRTASSSTSRTTRAAPGELVLFVVLADGVALDDELRGSIGRSLRSQLSPRHVPDMIRAVPAIPRTLTGKKLEAPVKRILRGEPVDAVASRDSLLDPTALDLFAAIADGARPGWLTWPSEPLRSRTSSRSTCTRTSRCRRRAATRSPTSCATPPCEHFRGESARPTAVELAQYYRERRMMAVVFTVDSESFTGQTRVPNEEIAEVARANADVLIPFASIDPHKGRRGVDEARRLIAEHGVRGFKFHPNVQGFFPNDRMAYPLYEVIEEAGLPALFHTGHSGVGSGLPGGGGVRLKYSNPMHVDDVAVDFPDAEDRPRAPVVPVAGRGDRRSRCTSRRSTSTSPAGRRSTSRRSSSTTRTRCCASGCCSAATTRSSRPTAGSRTSTPSTSSRRCGR